MINSGREVTLAMRTTPIQILPRPVFPARMSPYRDSFAPEKTISAVHATYIAQYRITPPGSRPQALFMYRVWVG